MPTATAQRLLIDKPGSVVFDTIDLGPLGPRTIHVRTIASGISHGTEMAAFLGTSPLIERTFDEARLFRVRTDADEPFYPYRYAGYDSVGVVEAIGPEVTSFNVGDRVYSAMPHRTAARFNEGDQDALRLAPDTTPEQAIMTQLTSVAVGAVVDAGVKIGDMVAVIGAGTLGQLVAEVAVLDGAERVFVIEPAAPRREQAGKLPHVVTIDPQAGDVARELFDANRNAWPDVVIDCSGHPAGLHTAILVAGVGGTVIAAGFYQGGSPDLRLGEEFLHNRVTVKASMWVWNCPSRFPLRWDHPRKLRHALSLIESGRLRADRFASDRVPFLEAQRAYEMIRDDPAHHLKVMLIFD